MSDKVHGWSDLTLNFIDPEILQYLYGDRPSLTGPQPAVLMHHLVWVTGADILMQNVNVSISHAETDHYGELAHKQAGFNQMTTRALHCKAFADAIAINLDAITVLRTLNSSRLH